MASVGTISGLASGIQWRDMIDQIMKMEQSRQLTPVTNQVSAATKRRSAWDSYSTLVGGITTAGATLKSGAAFSSFNVATAKSATTSKELVSATASTSAAPGTYSVEVQALAQAEKLRSGTPFSSTTDARGLTGSFLVNGREVTLTATDTLAGIRDKINAVNSGTSRSGVTASIVTVSATENYLTLTADNSGTRGIELVDSGNGSSASGVLTSLGVLNGTQSANTLSGATQSQRFTSKTTALASMLGLSAPPTVAYISVGGTRVQVDLVNDSIQAVLDKIAAAGSSASIATETVGGSTQYRLSTIGAVAVDTGVGNDQVASKRILEVMGFVKGGRVNETQAGVNSQIQIDGLTVERRTNTVTDAVAGLTLDLKVAELGTKVAVGVTRNDDTVVAAFQAYADAFNKVIDFQDQQRQPGAPLYADASLRSSITALKKVLLTEVPGIDPAATTFTRPAVAGLQFTKAGKLEVDSTRLKAALASNLADVKALFSRATSATTTDLSGIAGTGTTPSGTYAVNVTTAATTASATGTGLVASYPGTGADQVTVLDAYTGKTAVVALAAGQSPATIRDNLNAQFAAQGSTVTASLDASSQLVLAGSKYGTAASFTVSYQQGGAAYAGSSHLGIAAATYSGVNVAGTINGEAATGTGQTLSAGTGATAVGLVLNYTGTATGAVGSVTFGQGVTGEMDRIVTGYTRSGDGLIPLYLQGIDRSVSTLNRRASNVQGRLDAYQERLVKQFTEMESAMSRVQSQSSWLASQFAAMSSSKG